LSLIVVKVFVIVENSIDMGVI